VVVLGILGFGSSTLFTLVFLLPSDLVRGIFAVLLLAGFTLLGVLAFRQLRYVGFEAEFEKGKFRYLDTRPYRMNIPFYALDLTPGMVERVIRESNGITLRLTEIVAFDWRVRRSVRIAAFLDPEQLDDFEAVVQEWLGRENETADTEV
jgi:hypothetical protein